MPSDYGKIRSDNERAYGTAIGRIGPMLLADRYDDRTHFIFELLQNAEDALARRTRWTGKRSIRFQLGDGVLRVSHFGRPFDEADVRGVCGIAESTKGLTAIGRFGIGFKSVYAFTERPEIHSGDESFVIENFVWPVSAPSIAREIDETVILIPLKSTGSEERTEISNALSRIGATALLFLRELEEIEWNVDGGISGLYLRSQPKERGISTRRISVVGQQVGKPDVEEDWLIFARPVKTSEGVATGNVEIAFAISKGEKGKGDVVRPVSRSPLVAFFPTVLETHLGFLVQGPYRTTPSRDNVPRHDSWNRHCVSETAILLTDAILALRDQELLDIGALRCLPLDRDKFSDDSMFAPLFAAVKRVLATDAVLPRFGGGYTSVAVAKLSRTQELRELLSAQQLAELFDSREELQWLSAEISPDRTPELRQYLIYELDVGEVTPEMIVARLSASFLEGQVDSWILALYQFLSGQPALQYRALSVPLVRLEDGTHVVPQINGQPQAFLPGAIRTDFPTVRAAVCSTDVARIFLRSLGLTEPNPVDDVVRNILPKYCQASVEVSEQEYESDIRRMLGAFATDSKGQRDKLLNSLRAAAFVMAVDTGDGSEYVSKPADAYIATDRLKELFAGVSDVQLVDDRYGCLRGDDVREMLEACGAVRYLRPIGDTSLTWDERAELRAQAGHAETSGVNDRIIDYSLDGLESLLGILPKLEPDQRRVRAKLLWEELNHLEERRGKGVYTGEYTWTHYGSYRTLLDAAFVRMLNSCEWVPDTSDDLQRPDLIMFSELGWKTNPFLESKILFKPPIIAQLAKEAGIEPDVLDLLKKLGVTSAAELSARLGLDGESDLDEADGSLGTATPEATADEPPTDSPEPVVTSPQNGGYVSEGEGKQATEIESLGEAEATTPSGGSDPSSKTRSGAGSGGDARSFVSYVAAHHDGKSPDPDGLNYAVNMELESQAIDYIIAREPKWQRTPAFNHGYDLTKVDAEGQANRWCEVKAMAGSLADRPVALSRAQFDCAREHGADYWLYIVEHAGDDAARIIRIQDPAGKAQAFTFDRGWLEIAELEGTVD